MWAGSTSWLFCAKQSLELYIYEVSGPWFGLTQTVWNNMHIVLVLSNLGLDNLVHLHG